MSTKLDLSSATGGRCPGDQKIPATENGDFCVTSSSRCKSASSRQQDAANAAVGERRCLGNETLLVLLCMATCAVAVYSILNNRLLSDRLQYLEDRCVELSALSQQQSVSHAAAAASTAELSSTGSGKVGVSSMNFTAAADTQRSKPEVDVGGPEVPNRSVVEKEKPSGRGLEDDGSGTMDIDWPGNDLELPSDLDLDLESSGGDLNELYEEAFFRRSYLMEVGEVKSNRARLRRSADAAADADDKRRASPTAAVTLEAGVAAAADDDLPLGDDPAAAGARGQRSRSNSRRHGSGQRQQQQGHQHRHSSDIQQLASLKVAQFVAPRQNRHYVSDETPPVVYRFWQPDNQTTYPLSSSQSFFVHNPQSGIVTVLEPGIYLLYAQIVYHDLTGRWAFGVYVDDAEKFKCINTEQLHHHPNFQRDRSLRGSGEADASAPLPSGGGQTTGSRNSNSHSVYQTCSTSGLLRLQQYSQLSLRCLYGNKAVVMQPGFTYWGLVKLVSF